MRDANYFQTAPLLEFCNIVPVSKLEEQISYGNRAIFAPDQLNTLLLAVNGRSDPFVRDAARDTFSITTFKWERNHAIPQLCSPKQPKDLYSYLKAQCKCALVIKGTPEEMVTFFEARYPLMAYPNTSRFQEIAATLGMPLTYDPFFL